MKTIALSRKELYEKVWSVPIAEICNHFDVSEEGFEEICRRLNVPIPDTAHWRKVNQGKKSNLTPLPEKSRGVESVSLYLRDDETKKRDYKEKLSQLVEQIGGQSIQLDQNIFDKLVFSTQEGMFERWEIRYDKYQQKNKLLAVHVSPEKFTRALLIIDMFIKLMRQKHHDVIVEQGSTFALVDGEKIQISIGEKNSRSEYFDEYKHLNKVTHPTGCLYLRKGGSSWDKKEWKDGKILLEDQIPRIIDDLSAMAQEQKEEPVRMRRAQEEREEQARIKQEFEKKQKVELEKFRQLLLDAHRFSLANMLRSYIDQIERQANDHDKLTDEIKLWLSWAREKANWFDPSIQGNPDKLLDGIDLENLRKRDSYYSGYNAYGSGHEQTRDNFWKPWWSR